MVEWRSSRRRTFAANVRINLASSVAILGRGVASCASVGGRTERVVKLRQFMTHEQLCGTQFRNLSWSGHHVIASLFDGDGALLSPEEQALARELTGLEVLPTEPPNELYIGAGRRSGKARLVSVIGTHAAAQDYRDRLAPGETAVVACIAPDRRQARTLFGYCAGIVHGTPILSAELVPESA